jgi:16S rRNA processing protein RimM
MSDEFVTLARVVKTQGRIGEVGAEVHTAAPDRFQTGLHLSALMKSGDRRELEVEDAWPHKGLVVLKFQGIETIDDAERLIGSELQVPASDRAQLEPGWNYVSDLVGCKVWDGDHEIGRVKDVVFGAGEAPLLVVSGNKNEYEIPFAETYLVKVDTGRKEIRMKLPEGLLELNAPLTAEEKEDQKRK